MSSFGAVPLRTEPTRRELSERQARTVQRLADAAVAELRAWGYDALTVRNVARRAGVAPATAYTYFASREHLVTEVFWRRLLGLGDPRVDRRRAAAARVSDALADVLLLVADEPELAAACTVAMLATDPDVKQLRDRIGQAMHRRIVSALGEPSDPKAVQALEFAVAGALVQAGAGHLAYHELPEIIAEIAGLLFGGRP
jgi:TetR/AcrR family transcriptional regulator, cholesterol catabolism regulator